MNILIDTSPLQNANSVRGVGRYTRELVTALKKLDSPHHFYTSDDSPQSVDLIHYPFFDFFFATLPLVKKTKTVVTIHDVIPLIFPKHYPRGVKGNIRFLYQKLALHSVSHIITDSDTSRRDIAEKLHIKLDKITAVPLAASQQMSKPPQQIIDSVRKKYELPKNYLLYVGDMNYSKNILFLLRCIEKLPKTNLVMVGQQLKNTAIPEGRLLEKTIKENNLSERVFRLTDLGVDANQELCALYAGATAYIQPSLYEGFGLPVIEAMQCHTVVLSSVGGSLPEVVGDAAILFHPHSQAECIQAIKRAQRLTSSQRQALIRKGSERAAQFSWDRTAHETLNVYEKLLRG